MKKIFPEYILRIHILAEKGVGKHTLARKYCNNPFERDYMMTLGVQIESKDIEINEKKIRVKFFILGAQERFQSFYPQFCHGSHGAIVMYDIMNPKTLDRIPEWIQIIRKSAGDVPIFLVGNKADLENRGVSKEEAIKIKEELDLSGFYEISAETGKNVENMFEKLAKLIFDHFGIVP